MSMFHHHDNLANSDEVLVQEVYTKSSQENLSLVCDGQLELLL
jgi:hypothetical protein